MDDDPERPGSVPALPIIDRNVGDAVEAAGRPSTLDEDQRSEVIELVEEIATISKRRIVTGGFRVETRTELRNESAEVDLEHDVVDVTRVPINRMIDEAPEVRTEGDTTIVPVVEERFVIVKQFFLKEELHIRRRTEREIFQQTIELRRQYAVVERFDPEGQIVSPGEEPATRLTTNGPMGRTIVEGDQG